MDIRLTPLDVSNPDQSRFLFTLGEEAKEKLRDDSQEDTILWINDLGRRQNSTTPYYFIVEVDHQFAGYVGVRVGNWSLGAVEGAALKQYQSFYPARKTLLKFAKYCFRTLKLRKLKVWIPVFNKSAEIVARSVGFRQEGIIRREFQYQGQLVNALELGLFENEVRKHYGRQSGSTAKLRSSRQQPGEGP